MVGLLHLFTRPQYSSVQAGSLGSFEIVNIYATTSRNYPSDDTTSRNEGCTNYDVSTR
jgi:hypothetical protein